jgi:hypothetical protein
VFASAGGKMAVHGDEYSELIEFVSDPTDERMVGKTGTFKVRLEGDKWYHDGEIKTEKGDLVIQQVWQRVK